MRGPRTPGAVEPLAPALDARVDELTSLLLAARAGDRGALAAWVRKTQAEVWRLCAHLVARSEADDLTQETYLRAYRSLPGFRGESSSRTWLLSIARRTCAEWVRVQRRRRRWLDGRLEGRPVADPARPDTDPATRLSLEAMLSRLAGERRLAFVLTQVLGFSYAEAAEVCECPVGTIRSRVARARATLIEQWREDAESE